MRCSGRGVVLVLAVVALSLPASRAAAQPEYKVVHSFSGADGSSPAAALLRASDGYFYGTTEIGGLYDKGTIFRVDESGAGFRVIHDFDGSDGKQPTAQLVEPAPPDGYFYGTSCLGGAHSAGTVFRVDATGDGFEVLRQMDPATDGEEPCTALTIAPDGRLYGTTYSGGAHNFGTIYGLARTGEDFDVILDCDSSSCAYPSSGVVAGPDGRLYGAHYNTLLLPTGHVFRIETDGTGYTPLGGDLGTYSSPLSFGSDGLLYGAAMMDLFRMDTSGSNFLTRFAPGASSLREGPEGRIYGTMIAGGQHFGGTIFRIDFDTDLFVETIHDCGGDGSAPASPPILGADGAFYGTTMQGGEHDEGVVYRLTLIPIYVMTPPSGPAAGGTRAEVYAWNFHDGATLEVGGVQTGDQVVDTNQRTITGTLPPLAPGRLHDVRILDPDGTFGTRRGMYFADFLDVPIAHPFHFWIEWLMRSGVTAGCGGGLFCPEAEVTRAQMAVFLLKAKHGAGFVPPPCEGLFADVSCAPEPDFAADWIEQLSREGITSGCGTGVYCPDASVRRDQMAVFLLKALRGSTYVPPVCFGIFDDVPCAPEHAFAADWIEELYHSGITSGCSLSPLRYCPGAAVARAQMAAFLVEAFDLNQ